MNFRQQRILLIGLIIVTAAMVLLMRSLPGDLPPKTDPPDTPKSPSEMTYQQQDADETNIDDLLTDPAGSITPRGTKPLGHPPADLPVYPEATQLLLYRQPEGDAVQEFGVWMIDDATLDEVRKFYHQAAMDAGFGLLADGALRREQTPGELRPNQTPPSTVWRRDDQTLIIRIRQAGAQLRVSLILRYTMKPSHDPEASAHE